uniref:Peptidase M1 membrane alanine aminopeptidase domain-containing protein n=1 Tax=Chelonoidis abingdonii TaxID=106734 RepID=A0A8C0HHU6_CHEAB
MLGGSVPGLPGHGSSLCVCVRGSLSLGLGLPGFVSVGALSWGSLGVGAPWLCVGEALSWGSLGMGAPWLCVPGGLCPGAPWLTLPISLSSQWFGNLVTLRWWNDLWLNEGFASYVEYLGADSAEPSWHIVMQSEMYRVMKVDALASSHPLSFLESEINTPAQISEVFDSIAYSKGASVLRMLSEFLTEDSFKKGLQVRPWQGCVPSRGLSRMRPAWPLLQGRRQPGLSWEGALL